MENPILQRLRVFIKHKGKTIKTFCETIEATEGTVNNMFSKGTNPSTDLILRILNQYPNFNVSWLLIGIGVMEFTTSETPGENAAIAANALVNMADKLKETKPPKKEETNKELLDKVIYLAIENGKLEKELELYRKSGYLTAAEPKHT